MITNLEATIEDLYALPDNRKAEIVNGEIVTMSPTGAAPSYAASEIFVSLRASIILRRELWSSGM